MATNIFTNTSFLTRQRAVMQRALRARAQLQLYPPGAARPADPLTELANTFTRYASTQATAYDKGTVATSAGGVSVLERQAERAIAQVLGGAPGRSSDSFINALNSTFPLGSNGQVRTAPARSVISPYGGSSNGSSPDVSADIAAGLAGQISVEQANLYRQASVVAGDALNVLAGLQPFVPIAETDRVEALRALVGAEIQTLVDEFGRMDEPRPARVESYFSILLGPEGHLHRFGQESYLERGASAPATIADEAQIAGFELLRQYVGTLRTTWDAFFDIRRNRERRTGTPLFSERLSRASIMLPVIAEGNANLMSAMDSIGFTESERRSESTNFVRLAPDTRHLPNMTVNDLNEWIDRFASTEGPSALSESGQYGLEFVTDQADNIFWVITPILSHIKSLGTPDLNSLPIVAQALVHERVSWALDDLYNQLQTLADLAVAA
jgi:hypothetical protein